MDQDETEHAEASEKTKKKRRLHTYERARLAFERIQNEKRLEQKRRQEERERREQAQDQYSSLKRRKEKALKMRTRRGQPKLDAQMEVMLEKIERQMKHK